MVDLDTPFGGGTSWCEYMAIGKKCMGLFDCMAISLNMSRAFTSKGATTKAPLSSGRSLPPL